MTPHFLFLEPGTGVPAMLTRELLCLPKILLQGCSVTQELSTCLDLQGCRYASACQKSQIDRFKFRLEAEVQVRSIGFRV